jgi:hypothetical protein
VPNLRVAVTQRVQQDGQWRDVDTSFFKVNVWPSQAENPADSDSAAGRPRRGQAVGHRAGGLPGAQPFATPGIRQPARSNPRSGAQAGFRLTV